MTFPVSSQNWPHHGSCTFRIDTGFVPSSSKMSSDDSDVLAWRANESEDIRVWERIRACTAIVKRRNLCQVVKERL